MKYEEEEELQIRSEAGRVPQLVATTIWFLLVVSFLGYWIFNPEAVQPSQGLTFLGISFAFLVIKWIPTDD